jgi:hypothetical protein
VSACAAPNHTDALSSRTVMLISSGPKCSGESFSEAV